MFALTLKNLFAHKMRFVSTAFAVLLGVAFMAGTFVLTDTLSSTFDNVLAEANEGVDAMVRAPSEVDLEWGETGERIDTTIADVVARVDGVEDTAIQVTGYAQLVGPDGEPVGDQAQTLAIGLNWIDVDELNPYTLTRGSAPRDDDQIVIDRGSANEVGYQPGDIVTVLTSMAPQQFTISGIASFGAADSPAGASVVLFTDAKAQQVLSSPGRVDGVVVTAAEGRTQEAIADAIASVVPDDVEVATGDTVVAEHQAAFDATFGPFKIFMLVFAFIAVFVGAFIINNTFSITVAQQSKDMAMLRAVGASRRQVLRSVLSEATVTGIFASAVGLLCGVGVAAGLKALITGFGIDLPDGPTVITTTALAVPFIVGVTVTVASAWLPARRAARILPIAALRDFAIDRSGSSHRRPIISVLVIAAGIAVLFAGLGGSGIELVGLGAPIILIGVAVAGPVLARPATRVLGLPLRTKGVVGEMATRNAMRSPKRTARTASSLTIGVALVAFITVFSGSFKASLAGAIDTDFWGTHVIDSGVFDSRGGFSPELADDLRSTPGIAVLSESRLAPASINGSATDAFAFNSDTIGQLFDLGEVQGDFSAMGADGIAVQADEAEDHDWTVGSIIPVDFATSAADFEVRAIYDDATWVGPQFFDIEAFETHAGQFLDLRVYVDGDEDAIERTVAPYPTAEVLDKDAFNDVVNGEINQILGIIYALLALAVIIALLGIANTLALSIHERTRELGLLRAVGMMRSQVRSTIRGEAVLIALFGTSLGLIVGTFFGWATVEALETEGIDTFTIPVVDLAIITVVSAAAGILAAVMPARRAARLSVLDALATQ